MKSDRAQKWRQTWKFKYIDDPTDDEATHIFCEYTSIRGNHGYGMHLNSLSKDTLHLSLKMLRTAQQEANYPSLYTIHSNKKSDQDNINNATMGSKMDCVQRIIEWASRTSVSLQVSENYSVTKYDTNTLDSFMDALVYVAGFNTRKQVDTIYDIYQSLILKNSIQRSKANSPEYRLIMERAEHEYTHLGIQLSTSHTSSTLKTYIIALSFLNKDRTHPPINTWQKDWNVDVLALAEEDMEDIL